MKHINALSILLLSLLAACQVTPNIENTQTFPSNQPTVKAEVSLKPKSPPQIPNEFVVDVSQVFSNVALSQVINDLSEEEVAWRMQIIDNDAKIVASLPVNASKARVDLKFIQKTPYTLKFFVVNNPQVSFQTQLNGIPEPGQNIKLAQNFVSLNLTEKISTTTSSENSKVSCTGENCQNNSTKVQIGGDNEGNININQGTQIIENTTIDHRPTPSIVPMPIPEQSSKPTPLPVITPPPGPPVTPVPTPLPTPPNYSKGVYGPFPLAQFQGLSKGQTGIVKRFANYVYIVSNDQKLYRSEDYGETFQLLQLPGSFRGGDFVLDNQGVLYLTWVDNDDIYTSKSTNQGLNWSQDTLVSNDSFNWALDPHIVSNGVEHFIVFSALKEGHIDLYLAKFGNDNIFDPLFKLTDDGVQKDNPQIALSQGRVFVSFYSSNENNIYLMSKMGDNVASPVRVNRVDNKSRYAYDIATDANGHIYVAYSDTTSENDGDLYLAKSVDHGSTFQFSPISDSSLDKQQFPSLVVDSLNHIHVAWADNRNNQPEVFYAKSIDGGSSFDGHISLDTSHNLKAPSISVGLPGQSQIYFFTSEVRSNPSLVNIFFYRLTH